MPILYEAALNNPVSNQRLIARGRGLWTVFPDGT